MASSFKAPSRPMFKGWHLIDIRDHLVSGLQFRGLLWRRSVRKIGEGRLRICFDVKV